MPNNSNGYRQKMTVSCLDVKAGKLIAIMNAQDARELGINPLERAEITNPKNKKSVNVIVDITDTIVGENQIGLFRDVCEILGIKKSTFVFVRATGRPKSVEFIKKKLDGQKLSYEELSAIVSDISANRISEIEATAFVSGVYTHGFDIDETANMTKALISDGKKLNFGKGIVVDKHSIGGTNGRATMIVVPIIAAAGYLIPKTSSRAITSAAGTADAMEVLANVSLSLSDIEKTVKKTGACISWGGAVELAPADDKIIKIEHPLSLDPEGQVIASVMAKKASVGAKFVVIDLPVGPYVKVKTKDKAEQMALKFIEVGRRLGIKVEVVITNGSEPSGKAFGSALEAKYALEVLEGKFFDNLGEKAVEVAGALLELVGDVPKGKGYEKAFEILSSGRALAKMKEIIKAQGGKITSSSQIKPSSMKNEIRAQLSGQISHLNVGALNSVARLAGSPANPYAGLLLAVELGDKIKKGDLLYTIFSENKGKLEAAVNFAKSHNVVEFGSIIIETVR